MLETRKFPHLSLKCKHQSYADLKVSSNLLEWKDGLETTHVGEK